MDGPIWLRRMSPAEIKSREYVRVMEFCCSLGLLLGGIDLSALEMRMFIVRRGDRRIVSLEGIVRTSVFGLRQAVMLL